jgi:hypothetical protein
VVTFQASDGLLTDSETIAITAGVAATPTLASFQDGVDGYSGTRDTRTRSDSPSTNFGTTDKLEMDGDPDYSTLLRWDLSSIPVGSRIESALLTFNVVNTSAASYPIYELKRDWVETQATYEVAASGVPWEVLGAAGPLDRGTTVLGAVGSTSRGPMDFALNAAGIAVVQAWIDNPAANFGLILQNYDAKDGFDISSREATTLAQRPKLTIGYRPAPSASAEDQAWSTDEVFGNYDESLGWPDLLGDEG